MVASGRENPVATPTPGPAAASRGRLTAEQLNGCACVVCGSNQRAMIPLGLETSTSTEVFRCDREECAVDPGEVQKWIDISDKL